MRAGQTSRSQRCARSASGAPGSDRVAKIRARSLIVISSSRRLTDLQLRRQELDPRTATRNKVRSGCRPPPWWWSLPGRTPRSPGTIALQAGLRSSVHLPRRRAVAGTRTREAAPCRKLLPQSHARQTRTLVFARWVVRNRFPIVIWLISTTLFFLYPIVNAVAGRLRHEAAGTDRARRHIRACPVARAPLHPRPGQVRQEVRHLVAGCDGRGRERRQHLHARHAEAAPRDHAAARRRRLRLAQRRARSAARQAERGRRLRRRGAEGARPPVPALPGEPRPGALARALQHARHPDRARRFDHLRRADEEGAGDAGRSGEAPRGGAPEPALHLRPPGVVGRKGRADLRGLHHRPPQQLAGLPGGLQPRPGDQDRVRGSRPAPQRPIPATLESMWNATKRVFVTAETQRGLAGRLQPPDLRVGRADPRRLDHQARLRDRALRRPDHAGDLRAAARLLPAAARRADPVRRRGHHGDLGNRLHRLDGDHLRPTGAGDPDDHHGSRRLAHGADGRALLRGLRDPRAALRGPERRQDRSRHHRDGRADRARHARHRGGRRRSAGDPRDVDPADARPRDLRRLLGDVDPVHGGDPPPGHDLLPARAQGARALPAHRHGPGDALRRLDHDAPEVEVRAGRGDGPALHRVDLHHADVLEDRTGHAGLAAALAGPPVQRRHRPDRATLRRRGLVRGLHQRRPRERQRRPAADPADDRVRALDAVLHATSARPSRSRRSSAATGG